MKLFLAFLLVYSCFTAKIFAQVQQTANIRFERIQGINQAVSIAEDQQGFMWFAGSANGGLHKYNGYQVTSYYHDPEDNTSLSHNQVDYVFVDSQGTLWVSTNTGGLNRFNASTESFTRYQHDPNDPSSLSDNRTFRIIEDREGALWIGTQGGGLNRFDPETETFKHFVNHPGDSSSLSHNVVLELYEDREGTIWVGTIGGLNRFDRETETFLRYVNVPGDERTLSNNVVNSIFEDSRGTFWLGTWSAVWDGLHTMDRDTGTFTRYIYDPEESNEPSMPHLRHSPNLLEPAIREFWSVSFLHEDAHGRMWIGGCGGGFDLYDPLADTLIHYESNPDDPNSLGDNNVWAIHESSEGTVWIGTFFGAYKAVPYLTGYTFYQPDPSDQAGLSHGHVQSLFEDEDGILWIGTQGGGLNRLDTATGTFLPPFRYDPDDPNSVSTDNVVRPIVDAAGVLWVGTTDGGINRYDSERRRFIHYRHDPGDPLSLSSDLAYPFLDRQGIIWVGTLGGGLNRLLDSEEGTFRRYRAEATDTTSLLGNEILCFYEDRAGTRWICSSGGLNRFDPDEKTFSHFLHGSVPTTIHEDETGRFWVGSQGDGLFLLDRNTGVSTNFTTDDGLPSDTIAGILEDGEGNLWISTFEGSVFDPRQGRISRYDIESERFMPFGPEDGLPEIAFSLNSKLRSADGTLIFGGVGGLLAINPETFGKGIESVPPRVVLTEFRLFNALVVPGEDRPLRVPLYLTEEIELKYGQNDFTIDYVGLLYRNPGDIRYIYRLENHDEDWVDARTTRNARYSGLAPGTYVFRVRAVSGKGVWSEEDASVTITILPPWWRTRWAFALWVLLLVGAVAGAYRLQHTRIVRKERERAQIEQARLRAEAAELQSRALEAESEQNRIEVEKARELEKAYNKLKITQAQLIQSEKMASLGQLTAGVAHEIKNPLNFVNNFAEVNEELVQELKEILDLNSGKIGAGIADDLDEIASSLSRNNKHIAKHGRRADSIVKSMMEHAKGGGGQRIHVGFTPFVKENINLSYNSMLAQRPDLDVEIERDLDDSIGTVEMSPQELGRALINVLNNAFDAVIRKKESAVESYEPEVRVETKLVDNGVEIHVEDNGPGIPENIKEKIFEPFFTTKPTGSGTGLGLSLAYDIVTQGHGGTMTVESEEGEGATFVIVLPAN